MSRPADASRRRTPAQAATGLLQRLGSMVWVLLVLVVAGGVLVGWGFRIGDDYLASTLLEIGAGLFIAVPLIVLERLLDSRISALGSQVAEVREDVKDARVRIDELGAATRRGIDAIRQADARHVRALRDDVSQENVLRLLRRGLDLGALDPRGLRVAMPGSGLRLRFAAHGESVELTVEDRAGDRLVGDVWNAGTPPDLALLQVAEQLQRAGRYPGDASFDAEAIFGRLADAADATAAVRTNGRAGPPLGAAIELVGAWVLTERGLEHLHDDARSVGSERLLDSGWLPDDPDGHSAEAVATARDYHRGRVRRAARERVPRAEPV